jgi:hypothetical protein
MPKSRLFSDFLKQGQEPSALITEIIKILQDEAYMDDLRYKIATVKELL